MVKKHLKTLTAKRTWDIERKATKYISRPFPGKHSLMYAHSLNDILKKLDFSDTKKDSKNILKLNELFIDNVKVKEVRYNIGFMDVLSIPKEKLYFRVILTARGKIEPIAIDEKQANLKILQIKGKHLVGKNKLQLACHDGRNVLTDNNDIKVNDSIVFDLAKKEIKKHLKLEVKSKILLIGGGNIGSFGEISKIEGKEIFFKIGKDEHSSIKDYTFVIDESVKIQ
jgi:small subunit ribosomal protein S4e